MRARGQWWIALGLACGVMAAPSVTAQNRALAFAPPQSTRAVAGRYLVRWTDNALPASVEALRSITWYYSTSPDGTDRKRMVTRGYEDFSNFLANWRPQGPLTLDWVTRQDRGRKILSCAANIGPAYSTMPVDQDSVISVLVRPRGIRSDFSLGARVQVNGGIRGYEIRNTGDTIQILQSGQLLRRQPVTLLGGNNWYWYEFGLRTRKKTDVEIRVRIFDEKRERILASICLPPIRPADASLTRPGLVSITGPADFAELYVDPWNTRWVDDDQNEFEWNTAGVPEGKYYLIAEVSDGKNPKYSVVSDYQVEVRNPGRTASN